jgi:hypothetical protein
MGSFFVHAQGADRWTLTENVLWSKPRGIFIFLYIKTSYQKIAKLYYCRRLNLYRDNIYTNINCRYLRDLYSPVVCNIFV